MVLDKVKLKTINNNSLIGDGNITVGGSSVDIVTSWSSTTSDGKVPSEKLAKDSLDDKISKSSTNGLVKNDGSIDTNSYLTSTSLTNYVQKSSTNGLLKNDGTVDTTSYSTFSGSYNDLSNKPTIPSASSTTPSADTTSGSYGSGTSYARSNHSHPKSSLYAESSHTHTKSQITDFPSLSTVATSGSYADLSNKPSIPSSSSDLSDGSDLVKKSQTTGLLKNDGTVMVSGTGSSNWAVGNHTHSAYVNPTKVTSWSSTPSDDNVASEKLIKNSLDGKLDNSNSSTTVTIASEDKILITDYSDSNKIKRADNILASQVKDPNSHSNISTSANATQSEVNTAIDNKINRLMDMLQVYEDLYVFLDYGVTGSKNSNWYVRTADTTLTVTVDDDGTNLSNSSTTTSVYYFANPQSISSDTPPITIGDFVIECDVISTNFGSGTQIAFLLQGLGNSFNLSSYTAPYHIKMEKTGTTVKQYINDTEIRTTTISDRTNYFAGFQLYKNCDIKFKNYRIYTI